MGESELIIDFGERIGVEYGIGQGGHGMWRMRR
jgi:hypothetical protein